MSHESNDVSDRHRSECVKLVLNPPTAPWPNWQAPVSTRNLADPWVHKITLEKNDARNTEFSKPRPGRPEGGVPPSPLQRAAAWPPMVALLLGVIEAPHEAYSQLARASEAT